MGIENQVWSFKLLHNIRKHHKAELQTNLLLAKRPPCGLLGTVVMSQWLDYITSAVFPSLTDPIPQRICRNHNLFCLLFSILLFSSSYTNTYSFEIEKCFHQSWWTWSLTLEYFFNFYHQAISARFFWLRVQQQSTLKCKQLFRAAEPSPHSERSPAERKK